MKLKVWEALTYKGTRYPQKYHKYFLDTFILCLGRGSLPHTVLRLELLWLLLNALPEPLKADDADDSSYTQAQTAESTLVNWCWKTLSKIVGDELSHQGFPKLLCIRKWIVCFFSLAPHNTLETPPLKQDRSSEPSAKALTGYCTTVRLQYRACRREHSRECGRREVLDSSSQRAGGPFWELGGSYESIINSHGFCNCWSLLKPHFPSLIIITSEFSHPYSRIRNGC